jgi:hypothetical protein
MEEILQLSTRAELMFEHARLEAKLIRDASGAGIDLAELRATIGDTAGTAKRANESVDNLDLRLKVGCGT